MNTKIRFLLLVLLTFCVGTAFPQAKDEIKRIVIDAGHGGKDVGAVGKNCKEKDINLALALEIGKRIKEKCPNVEVLYTRTTDVYPALRERSNMANNKKADLFISIHCNAHDNKDAQGVETYVMGLDKSDHSLEVARRENASMLLEDNYQNTYGNFNPNSPESYVIFSLYANAYLERSTKLAVKVQNNLLATTSFPDRKVRQGGFWVLHAVAMPSILIEFGFVSNLKEEAFLMNSESQKKMAEAVACAFQGYKAEVEGKTTKTESKDTAKTEEKDNAKQETKDNSSNNLKPDFSSNNDKQTAKTPADKTEVKAEQKTPVQTGKTQSAVCFKVQIFAKPDEISLNDKAFSGLPNAGKYHEGNYWKYTVGNAKTYDEILPILKQAKEKYPDAFVVAFKNGEKIPVAEARKIVQ